MSDTHSSTVRMWIDLPGNIIDVWSIYETVAIPYKATGTLVMSIDGEKTRQVVVIEKLILSYPEKGNG